jgi:hypothetical protein
MFRRHGLVPELIPQLSPGKHRSPRNGACFMELASYLAGERWSDHPACTHPLVATLGRLVNGYTSDAGRGRLVGLVPSVIGLVSDDPHGDVGGRAQVRGDGAAPGLRRASTRPGSVGAGRRAGAGRPRGPTGEKT